MRESTLTLLVAGLCVSCVAGGGTVSVERPDDASFQQVSAYMEQSCGTLDCHGQPSRPMRIYGYRGMRLSTADTPVKNDRPTTPEEVHANYDSVCGLEPEALSLVVQHELSAEELLVVKKSRGEIHHKGYEVVTAGSPADVCLVSWLSGAVDAAACAKAAKDPP